MAIIHRDTGTDFYKIWKNIKTRCFNKNRNTSKYYINKGISCDEKWINYLGFKEDMYSLYISCLEQYKNEKLSIERFDNSLWYTRSNCTFIPYRKQYKNFTKRVILEDADMIATNDKDGVSYLVDLIKPFCKKNNLDARTVFRCLKKELKQHKGWTFSYIYKNVSSPPKKQKIKYETRFLNIYKNRKYHNAFDVKLCLDWYNSFDEFKKDMFESFVNHCDEYGEGRTYLRYNEKSLVLCKESCYWGFREWKSKS